ncbi:MAG: ferredoxin reductase, partial [Deltaproteobacteria bacterium]|nr:ferredoxin reductase [Deltaproteobacteria bacterium]
MKEELLKQLEGYEAVKKDIETSEKYGNDFSSEKGNVIEYINRLHPPKINFRVSTIIDETPSTKTFRLVSHENYLPPFQAGQYISLFLDVSGIRTSRPFSISSPPNQTGYYDITVRRVENGLVSNYLLDNVKKGDSLESSSPCGTFVYNPIMHDTIMVCIAGGSGITPFMSMIREITERGLNRKVYLFYGNKDLKDVIFHEELTQISNNFSNFFYIPVIENSSEDYTGVCGLISSQLLKDTLKKLSDKSFFLCGPKGLYDFCLPALDSLDVPKRKIRQEVYGTPIDICDYPGWPKEIKNSDTFNVSI